MRWIESSPFDRDDLLWSPLRAPPNADVLSCLSCLKSQRVDYNCGKENVL